MAKSYTEEKWSFKRPDCILRGFQFTPKKKARSAIILLHGFCMNRHLLKKYAKKLAEKGYLCIAYDARGHGETEAKLDITAMIWDVRAIVKSLRKEQGIKSIGLIGQSMGGLVSTIAAVRFKTISAVVLLSGAVDILSHLRDFETHTEKYPDVARLMYREMKRHIGGIPWRIITSLLQDYKKMAHVPRALGYAKKMKVPLLSIHGTRDLLIPFKAAKEFYEAVASEDKEFMILDADHDLCVTHFRQAAPVVVDFFEKRLKRVQ